MKKIFIYILLVIYMTAYASSFNEIYAAESKSSTISASDDEKETKSTSPESKKASSDKKEEEKDTGSKDDADDKSSDTGSKKSDDGKKDSKKDKEEAADDEAEKYSPHAGLMLMADGDTGLVMYEKNADKQFNPGGLVKILTAITAIELCDDLTKKVTVEEGVLENFDYEMSNIGLIYGETLSVQTLLEAMMVYDAGDCALVLANEVGKSYSEFIDSMNAIAKKAGAQNSNFTDPAGCGDNDQETTLNDMYKISKYAMKNAVFAKIAKDDYIEIAPTNKYKSKRILFSTNQFLTSYYSDKHKNPAIEGIKSYYISKKDCGIIANYKAGQSNLYILCAQSDSDEENIYSYNDVEYLIEYAKQNFSVVTLVDEEEFVHEAYVANGKDTNKLLIITENKIRTMLPHGYDSSAIEMKFDIADNIHAPVQKREKLGTMTVYYEGLKCGETNLLAYSDIESSTFTYFKHKIKTFFGSIYFKLGILLIAALLILKTVMLNKRKKSKK